MIWSCPVSLGFRSPLCRGCMNTKLTYADYVPELWTQKRMYSILLGFLGLEDGGPWTHSQISGIFNLSARIWEKRRSCFKCVEFFRRTQTQALRVFTQHPNRGGFCKCKWVGCVWFGWASSWTRATTCHRAHFRRHQGGCSFRVSPAQAVNQLDIFCSWHGPSWRRVSNCSDVTQSQSSDSSWFPFSKKKILRDQSVNTLWGKQTS